MPTQKNYRVPLSFDEQDQQRYGYNMYDGYNGDEISDTEWDEADRQNMDDEEDPSKDEMECGCGWHGTRGQLMPATGLKDDVEFIYCPWCGSDDVGEV